MEASQYMQQGATTTTTTTTTEVNFSREIGLDPSKIVKQTVNPNTQEIINSIEEEKKLRLSQVGKVINEPIVIIIDFKIKANTLFFSNLLLI